MSEKVKSIQKLADACYKNSYEAGWWDTLDPWDVQTAAMKVALIHSELSEAYEARINKSMDDKLPHLNGEHVELADAVIRIFDLMGARNCSLFEINSQLIETENLYDLLDTLSDNGEFYSHAHLIISKALEALRKDSPCPYGCAPDGFALYLYLAAMFIISLTDMIDGVDIINIAYEKLEYNKTRADHKRENRAAEGGKKI